MKRDLSEYVQDILGSISKIEEYTKGVGEAEFSENPQMQDAVMRRLEIIGEAVKGLPPSFRSKHKGIPWQDIAGMRDVLIHAYFGIHVGMVWKAVQRDLPELKGKLERIGKDKKE